MLSRSLCHYEQNSHRYIQYAHCSISGLYVLEQCNWTVIGLFPRLCQFKLKLVVRVGLFVALSDANTFQLSYEAITTTEVSIDSKSLMQYIFCLILCSLLDCAVTGRCFMFCTAGEHAVP